MPSDTTPALFGPGQTLGGRYRLERALAHGSVTSLFTARDLTSGSEVAVKVLQPQLTSDETMVQRFLQEARCATAVSHPHVAVVLGSGTELAPIGDGVQVPYLVEELLHGQTLRERLVSGNPRLPAGEAVELLVPVAAALELLHRGHIIHRDLKPENLFLTEIGGRPGLKLLDFGLSKVKSGPGRVVTRARSLLGSPLYSSPEQLRGDDDIDGRADQWSLGVVLFEVVAGRCPFRASTLYELIAQVLDSPAPPLDTLAPDAPPELTRVVARMLDREKRRRFPSMYAVQEALLDCSGHALDNGPPTVELRQQLTSVLVGPALPGTSDPAADSAAPEGGNPDGSGSRPRSSWLSRLWRRR